MQKLILLDWDGPVSNLRTYDMPNYVDPVAVHAVNKLMASGWQLVLSSTIRTHFETMEEADEFMRDRGFLTNWFSPAWRTSVDFVGQRHLEITKYIQETDLDADAVFLVIDDERLPLMMFDVYRMIQIKAHTEEGIRFRELVEMDEWANLTDEQIKDYFGE